MILSLSLLAAGRELKPLPADLALIDCLVLFTLFTYARRVSRALSVLLFAHLHARPGSHWPSQIKRVGAAYLFNSSALSLWFRAGFRAALTRF